MLATCFFIVSSLALIDLNIFWDQPKSIYNEADICPVGDELSTQSHNYYIFNSWDSNRSDSDDDFLVVLLGVMFCIVSYLLVVPIHRQVYMYDFFLFKIIFYIQLVALGLLLHRRYRKKNKIVYILFLVTSLIAQIYVAIQLYWILNITLSVLAVSSGLIAVSSEY